MSSVITPRGTKPLELIKKDRDNNRYYTCPLCGDVIVVKGNLFYGTCVACQANLIDYKPLPHQAAFHKSSAPIRLNIGGFGSGKTTASCFELSMHALDVANGKSLITAPILKQVKEAVLPELLKFLPENLIDTYTKSPVPYFRLKNGHEILVYASNDEENLRSLNLTAFYIEEASNIAIEVYHQLQARLRNAAANVYDDEGNVILERFMGIVCTNPEDCWIREEILLQSDKIYTSPSIDRTGYDALKSKDAIKYYHSFISSTLDNPMLSPTFIDRLCQGKSEMWKRKYIYCYLDIKEGAVYPDFIKHVIEPFPIPGDWKRVYGFDKGFRDPTVLVCGAVDPKDGCIYVYDEYYQPEKPLSYHAQQIRPLVLDHLLLHGVQADPSVKHRNDYGSTYQHLFQTRTGIYLYPADNNIDTGIEKVRDFMFLGKLKFFNTCDNIKTEARLYCYPDPNKELKSDTSKPLDKFNHCWDAIRYMLSPFSQDADFFKSIENKELRGIQGSAYFTNNENNSRTVYGGVKLWKKR